MALHCETEVAEAFMQSISSARTSMTQFGLSQYDQDLLLAQHDAQNVAALEQQIAQEDHAATAYNHVQCRIMLTLPNPPNQ